MRHFGTSRTLLAVVAAAALAGLAAGPLGSAADAAARPRPHELTADAPVAVVASGLNAPRSLAWGPDGHLLVSEGGLPSSTCNQTEPPNCFSLTGAVADVSSGEPVRIVTGLVSDFIQGGMTGTNGLTYDHGHLYVLNAAAPQYNVGLPPDLTAELGKQLGTVMDVTGGKFSAIASVGDFDYKWTEAHGYLVGPNQFPAADPYSLISKPGGGFYLVDAAANTLDSVDLSGHVQVLKFIPNAPNDLGSATPTCLSMGPDGAVYVGELSAVGTTGTEANVYRYAPKNGKLTVWRSGFSAITGCGFGANGDFYVTELDTTGFWPGGQPAEPDGAVIQISKNGSRTVLGAGKLFGPHGFAAGPDGSIYVANKSIMWPTGTTNGASDGEVVKIG